MHACMNVCMNVTVMHICMYECINGCSDDEVGIYSARITLSIHPSVVMVIEMMIMLCYCITRREIDNKQHTLLLYMYM